MKKILLMPNPYRDSTFQIALDAEAILRRHGARIAVALPFAGEQVEAAIPSHWKITSIEDGLRDCDVMVCFGGDGTILHAAHLAGAQNIPVLGVNTGTMGFLAELERTELYLLPKILEDSVPYEERMMLHVAVKREGQVTYEDCALNDAVITKSAAARVISLTVACDGVEAMHFDGDGVILSTPTGTTAYSMSSGGPVVEPNAENIVVTPICAHAMGIRSLVLTRGRTVTVQVGRIGRRSAVLSVDGGKPLRLSAEDRVEVTAAERTIRLLKVKNLSYYAVLNNKFQG